MIGDSEIRELEEDIRETRFKPPCDRLVLLNRLFEEKQSMERE